ncbi:MAG: endolytic transglycosylase MltG [Nitrospirota bacterium]|nr:endolytic transglycosylase MltG [Nitrospirota bacterium]MDH5767671.1 endolytic transglycosylase MltG [Nitrospirota bacterium]
MKRNVIFVLAGVILSCCIYVIVELLTPVPGISKKIEIQIPKGATFRQAIEIFSKEKLIRDKNLLLFVGRVSGLDRKIRTGYYSIYESISPLDIFKMLKKGQIIEYEVTIVEGDSLREIAEKLSEKGIMSKDDFVILSSDEDFLASYTIDAPTFEGYLFPDTYKIPKGMDPEDVVGTMINKMREQYAGKLRTRTAELGLSEREVLTLASIIEKEAKTDEERPLISAVYHNRLRKGILLQADPTSIYGIKSSREKITLKDLQRRTPYNTYVIKGLPPGPIASPGIKSISAAVYPADVPYIYFVSNDDGTHRFSVTREEHIAAVKSYREKKQANKEKAKEGKNEDGSL